MRIDPGTRVLLFDCYQTLVGIHTDEGDLAAWVHLAGFLRVNGLPADAEGLRWRYHELVAERLAGSAEAHPEFDAVGVFRQIVGELGGDVGRGPDDDVGTPGLPTRACSEFRAASTRWLEVFPDSIPALRALGERYTLGLVTDAQRVFLQAELRRTGLEGLFEVMVVSSDLGFRKPDPRMFEIALVELGVRPDEALYVGDSLERDVGGARAAGVTGVWLDRRGEAVARGVEVGDGVGQVVVIRSLAELVGPGE